ncbi:MAG: hypothetical protein ACFCUS_06565 [Rubrimonas sp.]|uniref:hypothetical protein n=1 Tax=Rubrimonas sp. TaxID=2036015 RepID=UPI002FDD1763
MTFDLLVASELSPLARKDASGIAKVGAVSRNRRAFAGWKPSAFGVTFCGKTKNRNGGDML